MARGRWLSLAALAAILCSQARAADDGELPQEKRPYGPPVIDISVAITPGLTPVWDSTQGLDKHARHVVSTPERGDTAVVSEIRMGAHVGTHVDAPSHFEVEEYTSGRGTIDKVDVQLLAGPAYVADAQGHAVITEEVLQSLSIPQAAPRLLLKTDNSAKRLMYQKEFEPDYVGISLGAAKWLRKYTGVQLLGTDYMSVGTLSETIQVHHRLFMRPGVIIPVEGLDLKDVEPGWYTLACLPLKWERAEGAPARCVLIDHFDRSKPPDGPTASEEAGPVPHDLDPPALEYNDEYIHADSGEGAVRDYEAEEDPEEDPYLDAQDDVHQEEGVRGGHDEL